MTLHCLDATPDATMTDLFEPRSSPSSRPSMDHLMADVAQSSDGTLQIPHNLTHTTTEEFVQNVGSPAQIIVHEETKGYVTLSTGDRVGYRDRSSSTCAFLPPSIVPSSRRRTITDQPSRHASLARLPIISFPQHRVPSQRRQRRSLPQIQANAHNDRDRHPLGRQRALPPSHRHSLPWLRPQHQRGRQEMEPYETRALPDREGVDLWGHRAW